MIVVGKITYQSFLVLQQDVLDELNEGLDWTRVAGF